MTQQAQTVQRPVGFADIVEKVKPAVFAVRVKVNAGPQNSSFEGQLPQGFERFFRRFGEDMIPDIDKQPEVLKAADEAGRLLATRLKNHDPKEVARRMQVIMIERFKESV